MKTERKAPEIVLRDGKPAAVILDIEHDRPCGDRMVADDEGETE